MAEILNCPRHAPDDASDVSKMMPQTCFRWCPRHIPDNAPDMPQISPHITPDLTPIPPLRCQPHITPKVTPIPSPSRYPILSKNTSHFIKVIAAFWWHFDKFLEGENPQLGEVKVESTTHRILLRGRSIDWFFQLVTTTIYQWKHHRGEMVQFRT